MPIQWFPGHMTSARKEAAKTLEFIDVVIEVLDARLPAASCNPMIRELRLQRQRPCLKILNKADLADPDVTEQWLNHFNAQPDVRAIALSCNKLADIARITKPCRQLAPHRDSNIKPLRLMIMGIPNVGKSTLMNALLGRRVAAVGDEPAITKGQKTMFLAQDISLVDTPGMMWPKIQHDHDGFMLAASHAIGRNAVIDEEVACELGEILLAAYPENLTKRYGFSVEGMDGPALIEAVAQRRGFRIKGGRLDMERAALILLQDYRDGLLGRVSLETPDSRAAMLAAYGTVHAEKLAQQAARKLASGKR